MTGRQTTLLLPVVGRGGFFPDRQTRIAQGKHTHSWLFYTSTRSSDHPYRRNKKGFEVQTDFECCSKSGFCARGFEKVFRQKSLQSSVCMWCLFVHRLVNTIYMCQLCREKETSAIAAAVASGQDSRGSESAVLKAENTQTYGQTPTLRGFFFRTTVGRQKSAASFNVDGTLFVQEKKNNIEKREDFCCHIKGGGSFRQGVALKEQGGKCIRM